MITAQPNPNKPQRICIVGTNAKSVAAAMMLTHFGLSVDLFGTSKCVNEHIQRYHFDKPLTSQWHRSLDEGSLNYQYFDMDAFTARPYHNYWFFLDQMLYSVEDAILDYLRDSKSEICFSGITQIGRINELADQLVTTRLFYIPFVFMNDASVFNATINPCLLLVGEKSSATAKDNLIVKTFLQGCHQHRIDTLKTIEFARSCMMNIMATRLSLINEMARLADCCQVDMKDVETILELDERLGKGFAGAGWGYGGSTLPKENDILENSLRKAELSTSIVSEVARINEDQKELIFRKLWRYFDSYIQDKTVVIWGAGYKTGTGRTMGSAIHTILPLLWHHGITTIIFDPLAQDDLDRIYDVDKRLIYIESPYETLEKADALIVINWSEDIRPDINRLNTCQTPIFDAKNLLSGSEIQQLTTYYTGMGRGIA